MVDPETLTVTLLVTDILDALHISYVIGGSMASIIHGVPRTTMDVDIVAEIEPEHVTTLVTTLQASFYLDEPAIRRAIQGRSSFSLIHLVTMFKVDIFLPQLRAFDQQQLHRRVAEKITAASDKTVWILSPEDTILAKLDWFRLGGGVSERQWRDILGVLKTQQTTLDTAYLREWARALGVVDLLEYALLEVKMP